MKHVNRLAGVVLMLLGLGYGVSTLAEQSDAATVAEPSNEACPAKFGHGRHAERAEQFEKRLTALHDDLKLTAEQQAAWNDWSGQVRNQMAEIKTSRPDFHALQKLTAPEKMEKWLTFGKERQARLEQGLAITKTFYGALSPEQRQTFDKAFDAFRAGGWKGKYRPEG